VTSGFTREEILRRGGGDEEADRMFQRLKGLLEALM
jgi:hypothetical protein